MPDALPGILEEVHENEKNSIENVTGLFSQMPTETKQRLNSH